MSDILSTHFSMVNIEAARDHRLNASHYRLLIAILSFRKKNSDVASVSREYLAKRSGYSLDAVSRITSQLQHLGWIEKQGDGGRGRWSSYKVLVPELDEENPANPAGVPEQNPGQPGQETPANPAGKPRPTRQGTKHTEGKTEGKTEGGTRTRARRRPPLKECPFEKSVPEDYIKGAKEKHGESLDWKEEGENFVDYHLAKGTQYRDWKRAWWTWCRKAKKFNRENTRQREPEQVNFGEFR